MTTLDFNNLVVNNSQFLRGFALQFTRNDDDASDLIQDTMLKAFRYKDNFKDGTNIKGWLYTIMRNIFINNYKRSKRSGVFLDATANGYFLDGAGSMGVDEVSSSIDRKEIRAEIDKLDTGFRVPLEMFMSGYQYDEIAQEMSIPMGTVKSRIFHARKKLTQSLQDYR